MWQVNFHQGNNLKSFPYFSMQDDFTGNAYTPIGEMFPNVYPYTLITEVKGESTAATRLPTGPNAGEWVGSLQTIDVDKGYWVMSQQDITLEFEGMHAAMIIDDWKYHLRPGQNLISFPMIAGCYPIEQFLPARYAAMLGILQLSGEATAAAVVNSVWRGSLATRGLCEGDGLWLELQSENDVHWQWGDGIQTMRGSGKSRRSRMRRNRRVRTQHATRTHHNSRQMGTGADRGMKDSYGNSVSSVGGNMGGGNQLMWTFDCSVCDNCDGPGQVCRKDYLGRCKCEGGQQQSAL